MKFNFSQRIFWKFVTKAPIAGLLASVLLLLSIQSHAQDWSFEVSPYLLAASIEGDASVGRATGVDVDVDFGDILENLDLAFMGHFEAHHSSGWGAILDYGFMDLSADISGPRGGVLDASVRQGILEALLVRRMQSGDGYIDYLAGVRWWDNDVDTLIDPAVLPGTIAFEVEEDWVDLVVGVRWTKPLSEKWTLHLRGDVGGFGIESDFTSQIAAGFHYQLTNSIELDVQYRALWVDYETGSRGTSGYFEYDTVTHGPIIGLIFNF